MNLLDVIPSDNVRQIAQLLDKAFDNSPSHRTDTEIRIGILDSSQYPTPASKYYKSLTEVNKVQIELMNMIFEYNLQEQTLKAQEEVDPESKIVIEIEKIKFVLKNLKREIDGRVKELLLWNTLIISIEPILVKQGLPLDNPDAYQKVFIFVKNIRKCMSAFSEEKVNESDVKGLLTIAIANAKIIVQEDLLSPVLMEFNLSEKEFVNSQGILPVTFTETERQLIDEAKKIMTSGPNDNVQSELKQISERILELKKQHN